MREKKETKINETNGQQTTTATIMITRGEKEKKTMKTIHRNSY